jgi:plastocyanin
MIRHYSLSRAAPRSIGICPPKDFRGPSRGHCAPQNMLETTRELENFGGNYMKRWKLLMIGILALCGMGLAVSSVMAIDGPRANATVSFGEWQSDPPLDRLTGDPGMGVGNNHELIPSTVKIKQGGSVNFIISGGHVVTVYDDGHQPEDINITNIEDVTSCATSAGGVLSDSNRRIYRGPCFTGRRDGVEVVQFSRPGTYLVICARKNHFVNDGMFGFVRVLPGN